MWRDASTWAAEAMAVFAKEWRGEFRTRYALNTLGLFAFTTLVVVSVSLGPLGVSLAQGTAVLPVLLWIILLFSAAAGLPRAFVHEEETQTATALRLAATPSALFCGKLLYGLTLTFALELLVTPVYVAMTSLTVKSPGLLAGVLAAGGFGLAAGSTLVAAIIAQARAKGTLFSVLAFPVLLPLLLIAVELTRGAVAGDAADVALLQLLLYDASVTVAGFMLFPVVWNP
ncbi:MAG TPA: heme exporter protein CcmB [Thermoanaerobaculia bacterium]|jgi:heme exporter protein B|nr:heme exporter protein CcmB [Thermoanaerobaculia bacterium]